MTRHLFFLGLALLAGSCVTDPIPLGALNASVGTEDLPEPSTTCGNGIVEDGEACDDGQTDSCGDCNAHCTGPGGPPVCGDGDICVGVEACDDGFTDDCGGCNANCTGPGTGSTCGDGVICPQTELCDEDDHSPCGACNLRCNGPGRGEGCVTASGTFDWRYVYLHGTVHEGDCDGHVIANVTNPDQAVARLHCHVHDGTIRPSDGRMLYIRTFDDQVREFHCDGCPQWDPGDPLPSDWFDNDRVVPTPACDEATGVYRYHIGPDSALIYSCSWSGGWYDEAGDPLPALAASPSYLGHDSQALGLDNGDPVLIDLATGAETSVPALVNRSVMHARARTPDGFLAAVSGETSDDEPELWEINADGSATRVVAYASVPPDATYSFSGKIDWRGNLYQTGRSDPGDDIIIRRPADGSQSTVVYDEADNPAVKMHASRLVTGP